MEVAVDLETKRQGLEVYAEFVGVTCWGARACCGVYGRAFVCACACTCRGGKRWRGLFVALLCALQCADDEAAESEKAVHLSGAG